MRWLGVARQIMQVLDSPRAGFPSLKTESKAACKMEPPGARHVLKNHCFIHSGAP